MNATEYITNYYNNYDEDGRLAIKHGQVEFRITMKYIEKYLHEGARILEIGAATGRYSHALAQKGYTVDAVELVEHNIELFKKNTTDGEHITIRQGTAVDLSCFADNTYDITLLLGPMYHLFTKDDELKALSEAIRVTKPGGIIYTAYCNNDTTVINYCFKNHMLREPRYRELCHFETFKLDSDPSELFTLKRKEDIDELMSGFDVQRLHYLGTDMITGMIRDAVDSMDDDEFEEYVSYIATICEREDMVGLTFHILDIFRKKGGI